MKGWKTWTGGLGMIGTGIGMICGGLTADPVGWDTFGQGVMMIFTGVGIIGVGFKVEKAEKAAKAANGINPS